MQENQLVESEEKKSFSREELYELVWKIPMLRLARRFGLSDVGLAKVCRRHNIPTPRAGHWAKKRHGKMVRRTSLPTCDDPSLAIITFDHSNETAISEKPPEPPPLASTFFDPELGRLAEIEASRKNPIAVSDSLRSPHPLVVRTRDGLIASSKEKSSYHRDPVLRPWSANNFCSMDVRVGQPSIGRAMRIMDALIKGLEDRGCKVSVPDQQWQRGTMVETMGQHFQIRLRESTKRQSHIPTEKERQEIAKYPHAHFVPTWDYVPTGKLSLDLLGQYGYSICAIRDGQKRRIEDILFKIPMAILRSVDDHRRRDAIAAENARVQAVLERQRREEEERRRLEEKKRQEELARVEALFTEAERWNRCRQLQKYLKAIRTMVSERYGFVEPDSPLDHWLRWADEVAERSNPLVALRRQIDNSREGANDADVTSISSPKPR
jgi:hypothetical protein